MSHHITEAQREAWGRDFQRCIALAGAAIVLVEEAVLWPQQKPMDSNGARAEAGADAVLEVLIAELTGLANRIDEAAAYRPDPKIPSLMK